MPYVPIWRAKVEKKADSITYYKVKIYFFMPLFLPKVHINIQMFDVLRHICPYRKTLVGGMCWFFEVILAGGFTDNSCDCKLVFTQNHLVILMI